MIQISDKTKCCGCTACASACPKNCISMQCDGEGFLYPVVDVDSCVNCGLCERVCTQLSEHEEERTDKMPFSHFFFRTMKKVRMNRRKRK